MHLNNQQRKHLVTLAHALKPVLWVGRRGITPALLDELDRALAHHELLKVKLSASRANRAELVEELCKPVHAICVQTLGNIATLYRPRQEASAIDLTRFS